jgi:surface protein
MFASLSNITVLNLGTKFNTAKVTNMMNMFNGDSKLTTIYAPTTFVTTAVTKNQGIFVACNSIIGGANTHYISYDISYAHIDGGPSNPGYFTLATE